MEPVFLKSEALGSHFCSFISNTVVWQHSLGSIIQIMQIGSNSLKSPACVLSVTESAGADCNRGETHLLGTHVFGVLD